MPSFEPGTSQVQVTDSLPLKLTCSVIRRAVRNAVFFRLTFYQNKLPIKPKQIKQTCSAMHTEEKKLDIRDVYRKRDISSKDDGIFRYVSSQISCTATLHSYSVVQSVPLAAELGIALIISPLMRILQRNLKRTTDTFLFISHTTNVLLFKFHCKILIGVRIIKEIPGSVDSGTHCRNTRSQNLGLISTKCVTKSCTERLTNEQRGSAS